MKQRVIGILTILFVTTLMLVAVYVLKVLSSIDLYEMTNVVNVVIPIDKVRYEEGGLLRKSDFKVFYGNSSDRRYYSVIEKNLRILDQDSYEVLNDFEIENLLPNDCNISRCIQHRIPFSNIPSVFSKGLIGIEDYRFLDHFGIDIKSIIRAIIYDIKAGAFVQGGSTLTQQIVKNLFFTNEKSLERKLKEAIVAIYLELKYDKTTILQTYFNEVFWGGIGGIRFKGLEAAARGYFNKGIVDLSPYEASILIAMLKGPHYYHPIKHTNRLQERSDFIFKKLVKLNLYAYQDGWSSNDWDKFKDSLSKRVSTSYHEAIYLSQRKEVKNKYLYFNTVINSKKVLKDVGIEDFSVKVSMERAGDRDLYYSRFERSVERAMTEERHQIGSTIKPLLYWQFFKYGYSPETQVSVAPIPLDLISGRWSPSESHKVEQERVSVDRALRESLNRPIVRIARDIGFEILEKDLEALFPDLKKPLGQYPAQLLGAVELSLTELHNVYRKFINSDCNGDSKGSIINILSNPKMTTIKRRVDKYLENQNFFGKTGTTNKGFDNWFVAYSGDTLYVTWAGVDGRRDNKKELKTYGSNTAFLIFQDTFKFLGKRISILDCK